MRKFELGCARNSEREERHLVGRQGLTGMSERDGTTVLATAQRRGSALIAATVRGNTGHTGDKKGKQCAAGCFTRCLAPSSWLIVSVLA